MAYDYIYYFEKSGNDYIRTLLGEVQNDFNMSFAIDGTKDSCKVNVRAYTKLNIKPYTICFHPNTGTWWIVASDRIDRFQNDKGFYYDHQLELVGAVELLNAIDLTDCGFLSDRYTLQQMLDRLISLSTNLDLPSVSFNSSVLDLDQNVSYTKTFENYTLLSALREIMDGYNCCIKLSFSTRTNLGVNKLNTTEIDILSKSGNPNSVVLEDSFNAIEEKTNINKNNYGTSVVSNAQNVISSKAKTYPAVGTIRLSANAYEIKPDTAVIKLPSNVYELNWLKMITPVHVTIWCEEAEGTYSSYGYTDMFYTDESKNNLTKKIQDNFSHDLMGYNDLINNVNNIFEKLKKVCTISFYSGSRYDPLNNVLIPPQGHTNPYFYKHKNELNPTVPYEFYGNVAIAEKRIRENMRTKAHIIAWERGSNEINGFDFLQYETTAAGWTKLFAYYLTDLGYDYTQNGLVVYLFNNTSYKIILEYDSADWVSVCNQNLLVSNVRFVVNYIPMSDMKIKYDNTEKKNIAKLYNQTGKLTDSVALSKLMLSHSKEIESDKITKYGYFYGYSNAPQVGSVVVIDNEKYVISNSSLDLSINDYNEYYIGGEFTLTKNISTKSLLTSPDTNIRDYNIPQNMNVKRKQLYRDFWEITHTRETNTAPIQDIRNVLNVSNQYKEVADHTAVIKLTYDGQVGGNASGQGSSDTWYYQLDCTTYIMNKSIYEVVDFKDNNIIGYDAMSATTGFLINEIFSHNTDNVSTPISYVDDYGKVKGIEIAFCNNNQLSTIYEDYLDYQKQINPDYAEVSGGIVNYSIFIDSEIYTGWQIIHGATWYNDFKISETEYNKDAIEVPVFEYSCQIDNSNDVIIGDNIFDLKNDAELYMYSYVLANKGIYDENNAMVLCPRLLVIENNLNQNIIYGSEVVIMELDVSKQLIINPLVNQAYNVITEEWTNGSTSALESNIEGKDLLIFRHKITNNTTSTTIDGVKYANSINDLMFVIRNTEDAHWEQGKMVLQLNAYKVN